MFDALFSLVQSFPHSCSSRFFHFLSLIGFTPFNLLHFSAFSFDIFRLISHFSPLFPQLIIIFVCRIILFNFVLVLVLILFFGIFFSLNPINFSRDQTDVTVNVYLCDRKVFRRRQEKKSKVMKESERKKGKKQWTWNAFIVISFVHSFVWYDHGDIWLTKKTKRKTTMRTIGFGSSSRLYNSKTVKMLRL